MLSRARQWYRRRVSEGESRTQDLAAREHLIRLHPQAARACLAAPSTPRDALTHGSLVAWCDALEGRGSDFEGLRAQARAEGRSDAVVELTALEALVRAEVAPAEAEALARRGVRMAATEELPDAAFLANVVLARVRRLAGRPHLATHILATLARYAPAPWSAWLAWELALSFGRAGADLVAGAAPIVEAVYASSAGASPTAPSLFTRDLATLAALCDRDRATTDDAVLAFRRGFAHDVPRGLHGLAALEGAGAIAWVVAEAATAPRRVLALGLATLEAQGFVRLPQSHRHRGRADTLLAACALASDEGLDEETLFRASYGFPFVPELHGGPLGVTIHRARQRVEAYATLDRRAGRVRLLAPHPILLPDPRCALGTEDRALQHIALGGTASARAIAAALDVSLRSAQQALEALVAAGLCGRVRDGNAVLYRVEDTTFHEPTQRLGVPTR